MLPLFLSACRCQQDAECQKIRNAGNQTVTPASHTETDNLCNRINTRATNDLAKSGLALLPDVLIKSLITLPQLFTLSDYQFFSS